MQRSSISKLSGFWQSVKVNRTLYLLIAPPILYFLIFKYLPIYGIQIAFRDYIVTRGIFGSPWVGLKYFTVFFKSYYFWRVIRNSLVINFYSLLAGFPFPILLALALNEIPSVRFKRTVQTATYMPYFISTTLMVGIVLRVLDPRYGVVNKVIMLLGGSPVYFMSNPGLFSSIYVWSGIWQGAGFGAIIYLAALSGIDPCLYESATVDGATKLQKIIHINIPGILPTITIFFIMRTGYIMTVGFEKVFLLQNPLNLAVSEVLSTYVYKIGIIAGNYAYGTAVGFFNAVINFIVILTVNAIFKRIGETSLW